MWPPRSPRQRSLYRRVPLALILALLIPLTGGCAGYRLQSPLAAKVDAGKVLKETGVEIKAMRARWDGYLAQKLVTPAEYNDWVRFHNRLILLWGEAEALWQRSPESQSAEALVLEVQAMLEEWALRQRRRP